MAGIELARAVAVTAITESGETKFGSGYILDATHILTAWHCVSDGDHGEIASQLKVHRAGGGGVAQVKVHAGVRDLDVVLLSVIDGSWWGADLPGGPVAVDRVGRERSQKLEDCEALGFPEWKRIGNNFDVAQVYGEIRVLEEIGRHRLVMRDQGLHGVAAQDAKTNPWNGFSGAAVFHDGRLLGMITEQHPSHGDTALQIQPLQAVKDAKAETAQRLMEELKNSGLRFEPEPVPVRRSLVRILLLAVGIAAVLGTAVADRASGATSLAVGEFPHAVAVNPAAHAAYVTDVGTDEVSVINIKTNAVTATVSVGNWPTGIAIDPAAHAAYVTNQKDNNVSVIDTATNTLTDTVIGVGAAPVSVVADPAAHAVYVANAGGNTVSVSSTVTNTVVKNIPVGGEPSSMAVDPVAHTVYVANSVGDSISVINTRTNTVTDTIHIGMSPSGVAVDPAAHTLYITNPAGNSVLVIHLSPVADTIAKNIFIRGLPSSVAADPAAHAVYVANADGDSVSVISTRTNTVTGTVRVGRDPHAVAVGPTRTAYVTNYGDGSVSVIEPDDW